MNIRIGFSGCGAIATHHYVAIQNTPNAVFVGATAAKPEYAIPFCSEHNGRVFDSYEDMLRSPDIDAVCILSPSGLHAEQTIQAIHAGKHVLVEKPMALTLSQADSVIEEAKRHNVKVGAVSQFRLSDSINRVKHTIDCGLLGRLVTADVSMKYNRSTEYYSSSPWRGTWAMDGGGALMNQGIHGIDTLLYLMGDVKSVYGITRTLKHSIEVEDTALAALEFQCGALGYIQGTTSVYPGVPRRISISGTKGTISLIEQEIVDWNIEGQDIPADLNNEHSIRSGASNPLDFDADGHIRQMRDFVNAILENREPAVNCVQARRAILLITAIYESSATGKRIDL